MEALPPRCGMELIFDVSCLAVQLLGCAVIDGHILEGRLVTAFGKQGCPNEPFHVLMSRGYRRSAISVHTKKSRTRRKSSNISQFQRAPEMPGQSS